MSNTHSTHRQGSVLGTLRSGLPCARDFTARRKTLSRIEWSSFKRSGPHRHPHAPFPFVHKLNVPLNPRIFSAHTVAPWTTVTPCSCATWVGGMAGIFCAGPSISRSCNAPIAASRAWTRCPARRACTSTTVPGAPGSFGPNRGCVACTAATAMCPARPDNAGSMDTPQRATRSSGRHPVKRYAEGHARCSPREWPLIEEQRMVLLPPCHLGTGMPVSPLKRGCSIPEIVDL